MQSLGICCISVALVLSGASSFKLRYAALQRDYNPFFDILLGSVVNSFGAYIPVTTFDLFFTTNETFEVGKLSVPKAIFGNLHSVKRTSDAKASVSGGNITFESTLKFGNLSVIFPEAQLTVLGLSFDTLVQVTVSRNEFKVRLTLYSSETEACAVELQDAEFTLLSGIGVSATPEGFFNQLQMSAQVKHLSQTILSRFNDINRKDLQSLIQSRACDLVPV